MTGQSELVAEVERLKKLLAMATKFQVTRDISMESRSADSSTWAVVHYGSVLNRDGGWEYEPMPSYRTEEFIQRTRFPLDEAIRLAKALDQ